MSAVEDLNVMIEQPCETLDDIAAISGKHATPVSIDESLVTLQDAARIARDGLAELFGIKLNRVGGLTKAARMRDIALAHGIDMFIMATGGSVLADTEALHLATTIPDANCHAVWACQDMLTIDIAGGRGPRNINGHLHLPEAPGSAWILMRMLWGRLLRCTDENKKPVHMALPLTSHETYYMANGKTCDTVETVVVRVDTDDGRSGWGEACPIPHYLPAYARGVRRPWPNGTGDYWG